MSRLKAALQRATTGEVDPRERERTIHSPESGTAPAVPPNPVVPPNDAIVGGEESMEEAGHEGFRAFSRAYSEKLIVSSSVPTALREQYRRLAASLHHAQAESGLKTLMVTSAVPDEGKTLSATNVALTLSESYQRRVLLIDADLRRPSLDEVFQVPKVFGLSEALSARQERKVSLIQVSRFLSLLTAGSPDSDPMSKLTSGRMKRVIAEAADAFEWVIMDTPPVAILTDAKLLSAMVDGALLVVRAGRTPADLIQRAVTAIGREKIVGVVLNRVDPRRMLGGDYSYYHSYYYGSPKRRP